MSQDQVERGVVSGLDLGKLSDHTAFAMLSRTRSRKSAGRVQVVNDPLMGKSTTVTTGPESPRAPQPLWKYHLVKLERWDVGTTYTNISTWLGKAYSRPPSVGGLAGTTLAVDKTGVGGPVVEMIVKELMKPSIACLKCNGTGWNVLDAAVPYAVLVFQRQNLAATRATVESLPNVKVESADDWVSERGTTGTGGKYQCLRISQGWEFAEWAIRKQGYAQLVDAIKPRPEYKVECMFCKAGKVKTGLTARVVPITITSGSQVNQDPADGLFGWKVPKKELVSVLQVLMGTERLVIDKRLPLAPVLVKELENFKSKMSQDTGHESFEAWRESDHDDCVLAVALALWVGERGQQEFWVR